jgi:hypothetical protein
MAEHMEVGLGVPVLSSMMCFSYSAKRENISLYQDSRIDIPSMARGLGEFVFKLETNSNFEVGVFTLWDKTESHIYKPSYLGTKSSATAMR